MLHMTTVLGRRRRRGRGGGGGADFATTAAYDAAISTWFAAQVPTSAAAPFLKHTAVLLPLESACYSNVET